MMMMEKNEIAYSIVVLPSVVVYLYKEIRQDDDDRLSSVYVHQFEASAFDDGNIKQ